MKINFFFNHNPNVSWNPYTLKNAGLGSNYTAIWNLSREMAKNNHDVTVFGYVNKEDIYDGVKFRHLKSLATDKTLGKSDIFISCESGRAERFFVADKTISWIHRNVADNANTEDFDHTIYASDFHLKYTHKGNTERTLVIPNGVDLELFNPQTHLPKEANSLVFIGHPIKGMSYLVDAKEKIKETYNSAQFSIHVYGNAELWGWDQKQFDDLHKKMIKAKIKYHGRVGQDKMARFMKTHQILFYPSTFQEPFGLSVLEAMAVGLVPVVSNVGNLKELVGDAGYVIDGVPTDFGWYSYAAEAVVTLFKDPELLKQLSTKAQSRAAQYSWQNIYKIWEDKILN